MTDQDFDQFVLLIRATGELYGKELSDTAIGLYWKALKPLTIEQVRLSMSRHMQDPACGTFMPKPADILRPYRKTEKPAVLAWSEVTHAMERQGAYRSVRFEDGTINAVIKDMGGWSWICQQDIDEPWTQREFERRYEAYRSQGVRLDEHLPGFFETDNRNRGYLEHVPGVVYLLEDGSCGTLPTALPESEQKLLTEITGDLCKWQ